MRVGFTALVVALVATLALAAAPVGEAEAAPAGDDEVIAFLVRGTGNGHGRGLSQWGAYGRAVDGGQTWQEILATYYGGTTDGTVSTSQQIGVRLNDLENVGTVGVMSTVNAAQWIGASGGWSADATSIYVDDQGGNKFDVYTSPDRSCLTGLPDGPVSEGATGDAVRRIQSFLIEFGPTSPGPADGQFGPMTRAALVAWQQQQSLPANGVWDGDDATRARTQVGAGSGPDWTLVQSDVAGPIRLRSSASPANPGQALGVCQPNGSITHYRGETRVYSTHVGTRTANWLSVEEYLRGVVPKEVPANWGDDNGNAGMHALRAQAVAARSYGLSQNRNYWADAAETTRYATTCDSPSCQVYGGAATRSFPGSSVYSSVEHAFTNAAIADTAGHVRKRNGLLVSTEFSASNGPRTAGGAYPPVDDPWDDVDANPNHVWTRVIDADSIRSKYGLSSANGVNTSTDSNSTFDGIWANQVTLGEGKGAVSAWDFRNSFSLPAPGFTLTPIRRTISSPDTLAFIGDSVGESVAGSTTSPLRSLTEGVYSSIFWDVRGGRTTLEGATIAEQVPLGTDLVVVELGYNDSSSAMPERIDAVMSALRTRNVGAVVWVNVSERRSEFAATNAAIADARNRWGELIVADWQAASAHTGAHRWFSDNVHLTSTGRAEFSTWVRDFIVDITAEGYTPPRPLVPGAQLRIPVLGVGGVPDTGVAGVALNVTAVNPVGPGWLRVWDCALPEPTTSSVNYTAAGAVEPNAVVVPLGAGSSDVCVATLTATDVIVDTSAWFDSGLRTATGRLVDTREGDARVTPDEPLRVEVVDQFGVPESGAAGVALNVTAVDPVAPGWLRVWDCGDPEPTTSSVNYVSAGAIEPNAVVVPLGADSTEVCIATLSATDVIVDVAGWFDAGLRAATGRLVDTRDSAARVEPGSPLRVAVTDRSGVPASGASGVALNVTAVETTGPGWLRAYPCASTEPETSSVNYLTAGAVEPNAVVVPVDSTGEVCISTLVPTEVVVDVAGWFDGALQGGANERIVDTRSGVGPIPAR